MGRRGIKKRTNDFLQFRIYEDMGGRGAPTAQEYLDKILFTMYTLHIAKAVSLVFIFFFSLKEKTPGRRSLFD